MPRKAATYDLTSPKARKKLEPSACVIERAKQLVALTIVCPACKGKGELWRKNYFQEEWAEICHHCNGSGRVEKCLPTSSSSTQASL